MPTPPTTSSVNSQMDAFIAYLLQRGITSRAEQAAALELGPAGEVLIARYLSSGRAMRQDVLQRALTALRASIEYDGQRWLVTPLDKPEEPLPQEKD